MQKIQSIVTEQLIIYSYSRHIYHTLDETWKWIVHLFFCFLHWHLRRKFWTFWEGHKIWKNLPLSIWCYAVASNFQLEEFFKICAFLRMSKLYTFSCMLSLLHKKKGGRAWSGNLCEDVVTKCTEDDGFWYTKLKPRLVSMAIVVDFCRACCFAVKPAIPLHRSIKRIHWCSVR